VGEGEGAVVGLGGTSGRRIYEWSAALLLAAIFDITSIWIAHVRRSVNLDHPAVVDVSIHGESR
jgi:hypothetical protein